MNSTKNAALGLKVRDANMTSEEFVLIRSDQSSPFSRSPYEERKAHYAGDF